MPLPPAKVKVYGNVWLSDTQSPFAAIPEPTPAMLLGLAGLFGARFLRQRS